MDMPWKEAIIDVLKESGEGMSRTEIAEAITSKGLRTKKLGATPGNTVAAQISMSIGNEGEASPFIRVGRGIYALKSVGEPENQIEKEAESAAEEQEEAGGIKAFGVYWSRAFVNWSNKTKLFGQQQLGAKAVDVSQQIGIYLLYDEREVIYVGRSIDRPIGKRLYEHTQDRLRARWNRFSWFGLYPVQDDGKLLLEQYPSDGPALVRALEAVLIESLEPRQNRKRGDDFSGIEYIQKIDPNIEKRQQKQILEELMSKVSSGEN